MPSDPNNPRRNASWTSSNGLTTTGTLNPFGLTQNNPAAGYFGASQPQAPAQPPPVTLGGTANQAAAAGGNMGQQQYEAQKAALGAQDMARMPPPPLTAGQQLSMTGLGPQGAPPAPAPMSQPMVTGDPRRPHPLLPEVPTLDANAPIQPAVEPPPMSTADLITGGLSPRSRRGGLAMRGY